MKKTIKIIIIITSIAIIMNIKPVQADDLKKIYEATGINYNVFLNDEKIDSTISLFTIRYSSCLFDYETYVPIRKLCNILGVDIEWNEKERSIELTMEEPVKPTVDLEIDKETMMKIARAYLSQGYGIKEDKIFFEDEATIEDEQYVNFVVKNTDINETADGKYFSIDYTPALEYNYKLFIDKEDSRIIYVSSPFVRSSQVSNDSNEETWNDSNNEYIKKAYQANFPIKVNGKIVKPFYSFGADKWDIIDINDRAYISRTQIGELFGVYLEYKNPENINIIPNVNINMTEQTAITVADAIFLKKYGKDFIDSTIVAANETNDKEYFVISRNSKSDMNCHASITINKTDGQIISVDKQSNK